MMNGLKILLLSITVCMANGSEVKKASKPMTPPQARGEVSQFLFKIVPPAAFAWISSLN
jgi:hypothetical protein